MKNAKRKFVLAASRGHKTVYRIQPSLDCLIIILRETSINTCSRKLPIGHVDRVYMEQTQAASCTGMGGG